MKKYFLFLFLISNISHSQNEFEVTKKIDSISKINGKNAISDGVIEIRNKRNRAIGSGGESYKIFLNYSDEKYFATLSKEEKKKYQRKHELIKGNHHQVIHYKNSYSENIYSDFYYQNNKLFYIKIKIIRSKKGKNDEIEYFEYTTKELEESKAIKNEFLFDVQSWVIEKNKRILDLYNFD